MSKFTKGPWYVWADLNGRANVGPSPNYSVAEMWNTPLEGQEANARLIAAAPDLYEALRGVMDVIRKHKEIYGYEKQHYVIDMSGPEFAAADAALAKADWEGA